MKAGVEAGSCARRWRPLVSVSSWISLMRWADSAAFRRRTAFAGRLTSATPSLVISNSDGSELRAQMSGYQKSSQGKMCWLEFQQVHGASMPSVS